MPPVAERESIDLFASGRLGPAFWVAFGVVFVIDLVLHLPTLPETILWAGVAAAYGFTCSVNAIRCGRIHCYFTGPFLFGVAGLVLAIGLGIVEVDPNPGRWLIPLIVGVFLILRYLPDRLWGRYR